jgi:hypothetical protein
MSGRAAAGFVRGHPRTNRRSSGSGPCDRGSPPSRLPQAKSGVASLRSQLGRTTAIPAPRGGSRRLLETLVGQRRHRQPGGGFSDSSGLGATAWPAGQAVGGVSAAGTPWLAKGGAGPTPSHEPTRGSGGLEKELPEAREALLTRDGVPGRHVRLMFQAEARFGRRVRIRRGWAPAPQRPGVDKG